MQYSTELDFYVPRISALAVPLTHELRDYFMGSDALTLFIDGTTDRTTQNLSNQIPGLLA